MKNSKAAFESLQRFRFGTDWRWQLARRGLAGSVPESLLAADRLVEGAADYLGLSAQGEGGAFLAVRRYPQIHAALGVWNDPHLQTRLKILVVGDCSLAEIAARLGIGKETVKITESLLFDVRGQLQASSWVVCAVIGREEREGNTDLGTHLRMAYFGGSFVAQEIVDSPDRLPVVEADRLYDQSTLLHAKAQQALAVPLRDRESALKFLKMFMDYKCKTDELELEREKFRHRCEQELRCQRQTDQPAEVVIEEPPTPVVMPSVACRSA